MIKRKIAYRLRSTLLLHDEYLLTYGVMFVYKDLLIAMDSGLRGNDGRMLVLVCGNVRQARLP